MSRQDEYKDLEERLRQARPSTEPSPPAWKNNLRAQLMEKAVAMNQEKITPGRILAAAGAFIILIGIPLLFWFIQGSMNQSQPLSSGAAAEAVATALPATTQEKTAVPGALIPENTVTPVPLADDAWIVSVEPPPGAPLTPQSILTFTVGYDLQSVAAAQLQVKLVTGENEGIGVGTGETAVSQGQRTAVIPVPLADMEILADGDEVSAQLLLVNPGAERLLYLDMPGEMRWPVQTTSATAAIVRVGPPAPFQPPGDTPTDKPIFQIDITAAYTLTGSAEAILVINAAQDVAGGVAVTSATTPIREGSDLVTTTLTLPADAFATDGTLLPAVTLSAQVNQYNAETGQYTNLYPGDAELPQGEAAGPPPESPDIVRIGAIMLDENSLNVSLDYHLESAPTATLTLEDAAATAVAEPLTVAAGDDNLTLPITANTLQAGMPLTITAVLDSGAAQTTDSRTLRLNDFQSDGAEDLWIAHIDVITGTAVPADMALLQVTVGYRLGQEFSAGAIRYSVRHQTGNAGGGGGGGGEQLSPGLGIITFPIYLPQSALTGEYDGTVALQFELTGTAVAGQNADSQVLSTLTPDLSQLLPES